jgi:ferredoxin-fold anticodon binding domain-containing protein
MNQIIEAEIFAKLHSDDREALGEELAIKHIVEANVHASIVFKYITKKITEEQMRAELEAARGKFTKHDIPEAEIFAKSIGELGAERGEITTKEIMEAKIFAKCFARAIAKVSAEQDADKTSRKSPTYRIAAIDPQQLPPSHGTIWLDGNEVWFSTPSKDFSFDGRPYHIPGGATCFPREKIGRQVLLKILRTQRDLWAPGDKEALKARLIEWAEKSQG